MKEELEEKIRRLEEDRNSVDINADLWFFEHNKRGSNQNPLSSKRGPKGFNRMKSRRKAVTVSGPYIVYMLRDEEIIEDWTIIKKAMSQRKCDLTY
ncbi:breast cancer metastasis-suppressor 1-like protein [Diaphorina citri]|nr:breast cancer metastasis-suppressor 1-like protein [Diaphorina citri]